MARLTNKDYKEYASPELDELVSFANINPNDVCKSPVKELREQQLKLGQLEDIEDAIGMDLAVLFKALINGFYVKKENGSINYVSSKELSELDDLLSLLKAFIGALNGLKERGATWALTKEELTKKEQPEPKVLDEEIPSEKDENGRKPF